MTAAGLVLAAGAGRRFGGPKALARIDGVRLVDRMVAVARDGGCRPVVVVEGAASLAPVSGARVVHADDWAEGMGASLRTGLAALPDDAGACVVLLVDTPWLTGAAVRHVLAGRPGRGARVAVYEGRRAHPVVLARAVWPEVARLAVGDEGARAWMRAHPDEVTEVDCTGLADPTDVDVPGHGVHLTGKAGPPRPGPTGPR
ncbi:MAG: nucleotidyltransferase family protein [Streptosporangiales bacterium]|nr:nucleotidyltransferase family protein [Streptosporangiales bacterium]MBO0889560.1 nucleotidyltransferase family protein [Acidothermales bacterium]